MNLTKNTKIVVICILASIVIAIIPLATIHDSEFGGSDGQAEELISVVDPNYEAWAAPILEPPGGETEALLFCLQAAIGSGVFFFGLGYLVARKKYKNTK